MHCLRFGYESELYPEFEAMKRKYNLDVELAASGFTKQMAKDLNAVSWMENFELFQCIPIKERCYLIYSKLSFFWLIREKSC
ncbi:unnamed protein product [Anisakis simplex]|uniref:Asparagine synthase (glutamine-hydrolyzing) n=1 Tax=Anisakis simplex TaxID=6269 RepID=A0A0M3JMP8_ANISI|nr:unnamed protein product [Anisakis simplex]